ncbi:hypothetical protein VNO78_12366 [Psophocarpus tetragonolobus]|uniref:Uncharacterized protein n=1 Tax=Psophocarpus tetragonolobus TaxID=3891 RepID=A0AAN9SMW1_PSOTE
MEVLDKALIAKKSIKAIPEGFANLPNLVHLSLFFNQLEGLVPKTGLLAHINASSMMENQNLYGAKGTKLCNSKERNTIVNHGAEYSSTLTLERFTPKELENATRFFNPDSIIGANSLIITVYKEWEDLVTLGQPQYLVFICKGTTLFSNTWSSFARVLPFPQLAIWHEIQKSTRGERKLRITLSSRGRKDELREKRHQEEYVVGMEASSEGNSRGKVI